MTTREDRLWAIQKALRSAVKPIEQAFAESIQLDKTPGSEESGTTLQDLEKLVNFLGAMHIDIINAAANAGALAMVEAPMKHNISRGSRAKIIPRVGRYGKSSR